MQTSDHVQYFGINNNFPFRTQKYDSHYNKPVFVFSVKSCEKMIERMFFGEQIIFLRVGNIPESAIPLLRTNCTLK